MYIDKYIISKISNNLCLLDLKNFVLVSKNFYQIVDDNYKKIMRELGYKGDLDNYPNWMQLCESTNIHGIYWFAVNGDHLQIFDWFLTFEKFDLELAEISGILFDIVRNGNVKILEKIIPKRCEHSAHIVILVVALSGSDINTLEWVQKRGLFNCATIDLQYMLDNGTSPVAKKWWYENQRMVSG